MISRQMELHSLNTGRKGRVTTALTLLKQYLFKYQGHVSAALVLGGVDITGPQLFTIHPHVCLFPLSAVVVNFQT